MKKLQSFNSFISEKKTDLWSPYQKADILAGDMFGEMGLFSLSDDQLDQIIDLKKADKLAKKHFGEFGFKTLAAKEMEELIDNNPKLLRESTIHEGKTISFAKASMMGAKILRKINIGTILDTKGGQYEITDYGQQANAFKEFEAEKDGKIVKVKLTAMYGLKLEVTDDVRSARFNKEEEIIGFIMESAVNEAKIKIVKDEWPYLEFKVGGKLHKVDFDYEDIIDDHGNEGQDQYWLGKDEKGQDWMIDVYASSNGDVEEVWYDTIVKESVVTEALTIPAMAAMLLGLGIAAKIGFMSDEKYTEMIGSIKPTAKAIIKTIPVIGDKIRNKELKDYQTTEVEKYLKNEITDKDIVEILKENPKLKKAIEDVSLNGSNYREYYKLIKEIGGVANKWGDAHRKFKSLRKKLSDGKVLESAVAEAATPAIYVQDERHFGKKGIIIMINDHGDVTSAIFKDKKNADKYDRNNMKDLEALLKLAKDTKYPNPIDEQFLTEGKWSNIMKGVRKGAKAGPWAIVSIENGKVINQELVSIMDAIPAHYEGVKKEFPKAKLSIEDNEGRIVYNESVMIEISEKFTFGKKDKFSDNDINDMYGFYGTLDTLYDDAQKEEFWKNTFAYLVSSFGFTDEGALYFLNAKIGRWLADQFADSNVTMGNDGVFDVIDNFAKSSQWKRWAKEYNDVATEEMANESAIYETFDNGLNEEKSSTEVLADDVSGELYTATLKGKSVTVKATTTTKTWDDGVPVLKYLARGKGKSINVELNRSFDVVHDVAHGWFYFTDGRKWFGMHQSDGYGEADDLPFNVVIKESKLIKEAKMDRDDFIDHLKMKFSIDFVSTTEEFNGSEGGVWVSGESGDVYKGKIIYDYYSEDHKNYELGVLNKFEKQINKIGWYSEWYDAGTVMIWPL